MHERWEMEDTRWKMEGGHRQYRRFLDELGVDESTMLGRAAADGTSGRAARTFLHFWSMGPRVVGEGCGIEFLPILPPTRQVQVHQRDEAIVMAPFEEVNEFVDDEVLEAVRRLLDKFEIQPD